MAVDYVALKAECQQNPNNYTDGAGNTLQALFLAGADQGCADILNKVRAAIDIARSDVSGAEIIDAIDIRDLSASGTTLQGSWFESFTQSAIGVALLKPNGTTQRRFDNLLRIMGNTNGSETRLRQLATRKGSRAEQLFGEGTVLSDKDIIEARKA